MKRILSAFLAFGFLLSISVQAEELNDIAKHLSPADRQIEEDLELLLTSPNEISVEIQKQNLSLFGAALEYNKSEAVYNLLASSVIAFFFLKDPIRLGALYTINSMRFLKAMRTGEELTKLEYLEAGTKITTASFVLSVSASLVYMSTTLFQKGICLFNCVENFSMRVTDDRQSEFLRSSTYAQIEKEIGAKHAAQFVAILKQIRDQNYGNEEAMDSMVRLITRVNGAKLTSMDHVDIHGAPTFSRAVETVNGTYNIVNLVTGYLYKVGLYL